jgi:hypothetical protein
LLLSRGWEEGQTKSMLHEPSGLEPYVPKEKNST